MYGAGRFLQVVGMILLPIGIAGNVVDQQRWTLGYSLALAGLGVAVFILGYGLQQLGKPK